MASTVEVRTDIVAVADINTILIDRLSDDWELVFMDFATANPGIRAFMIMVFRRKV